MDEYGKKDGTGHRKRDSIRRPRNVGAAQNKPSGGAKKKRLGAYRRNPRNSRPRNGASARHNHPARRRLSLYRGVARHGRRIHKARCLQNGRGRHGARGCGGEVGCNRGHFKKPRISRPHENPRRIARRNRVRLRAHYLHRAGHRHSQHRPQTAKKSRPRPRPRTARNRRQHSRRRRRAHLPQTRGAQQASRRKQAAETRT